MRTTITFDDDTSAAVDALRRERGVGVSSAVNELIRRGLARRDDGGSGFVQRTSDGHALVDVSDTAATLEFLDGPAAR